MKVKVYPNPEKLSESTADFIVETALSAVEYHGRFTWALSGGHSPQQTYKMLASEPLRDRMPWEKTYIFWGDERFVPPDDPDNNARMAREVLLDHVPVPSDHILPIPTDGTPESAAERYGNKLKSIFEEELPQFDLVMLGLGENGHTASLFPGTDVLEEQTKWVAPVSPEDTRQERITLTIPVINNARNILLLAYGQNKAVVLHQVLEGKKRPRKLPAQLIHPEKGELYWFVDDDAASKLETIAIE